MCHMAHLTALEIGVDVHQTFPNMCLATDLTCRTRHHYITLRRLDRLNWPRHVRHIAIYQPLALVLLIRLVRSLSLI